MTLADDPYATLGPRDTAHIAGGEQPVAPYLDALVAYGFRGPTRFHVPGHKGGPGADPGLRAAIGSTALQLDIPQDIEGIDLGPKPTPYDRAEQLAASAHGAAQTWFLTNGATQGNHALCLALAPLGAPVVVQRNSHSSVIDGLVLSGGHPTFVAPEYDTELGMAHGVVPESLEAALDACPGARAAFVVSPTYYGLAADVAALAEVAHARGVPLIVDQSWGSHFGFHPGVPPSSLLLGADVALTSTHKIVGSLTQSALLHAGRTGRVDPAYQIAAALRATYDIHLELATHATCVLVLGLAQPIEDLERFAIDFAETIARLEHPGEGVALTRSPGALRNEVAVSPRDAFLGEAERVDVDDAVGRVSAETIAGYPPGIPALLPGERITDELIAYLRELVAAGARLHGASDPAFHSMFVLSD